jgi:hypothetical protein
MISTGPGRIRAYLNSIDGDEKFLITLGAGIVNSVLLVFGFLDMGTYATLTIATVAAFIAGASYTEGRNASVA